VREKQSLKLQFYDSHFSFRGSAVPSYAVESQKPPTPGLMPNRFKTEKNWIPVLKSKPKPEKIGYWYYNLKLKPKKIGYQH